MAETSIDFDNPWKASLEKYFEAFMAFFFPEAHADVDWERGYELLDKELQAVTRDAEIGRRQVDTLVKLWRKDGEEAWVLAHVEIQSQQDSDFARRMFVYHYRIYDRHERKIASFGILGDEVRSWRPTQFEQQLWGSRIEFQFPIVKLLDFQERWQELEADTNPFATVVMAHLKAQETRYDLSERKAWKLALTRRLYEKGYERQDILDLFRFIDWMLELPQALETDFWQTIEQYEAEKNMPYITSVERIGIKKGIQLTLESLLSSRFGQLDSQLEAVIEYFTQLDSESYAQQFPLLMSLSREELVAQFGATATNGSGTQG